MIHDIRTHYDTYCEIECPYKEVSTTGRTQCHNRCPIYDFVDYVEEIEKHAALKLAAVKDYHAQKNAPKTTRIVTTEDHTTNTTDRTGGTL